MTSNDGLGRRNFDIARFVRDNGLELVGAKCVLLPLRGALLIWSEQLLHLEERGAVKANQYRNADRKSVV